MMGRATGPTGPHGSMGPAGVSGTIGLASLGYDWKREQQLLAAETRLQDKTTKAYNLGSLLNQR